MNKQEALDIRPSPIAGAWYPGTEMALRRALESYMTAFNQADASQGSERVVGLLVPHAGYVYSGATAAAAFQAIRRKSYQKVVVISPSHRAYAEPLLTSGHDAYQTPLGLVSVDHKSLDSLDSLLVEEGLHLSKVRFDQEHSLEIEQPFLQYLLAESFELIPVMMLDQRQKTAQVLAQALFRLIQSFGEDEQVLLVASSDLSHFYPQNRAKMLDEAFIKALETGEIDQLYQAENQGRTEACGLGPAAVVMSLSQMLGANNIRIADYRDSSHASGDKSAVVGYVSAIFSHKDTDYA